MRCFSNDVDILRYEPVLFSELYLREQVMASGSGATVAGTTLTAPGADFSAAGVAAGGVVYLCSADGAIHGSYEVVSVDSLATLTVSVVRADASAQPVAPPAAGDVTYRVCTYRPQAVQVARQLTERFGLAGGEGGYTSDDIVDGDVLWQASTYAVIAALYAMHAGAADQDGFWEKSRHYRRLSDAAARRCTLALDADGDGIADCIQHGACPRLVRE